MKNMYTKPRGWGAHTPKSVLSMINNGPRTEKGWLRPIPYYSITDRFLQAWDVFTYKADALYWKELDEDDE